MKAVRTGCNIKGGVFMSEYYSIYEKSNDEQLTLDKLIEILVQIKFDNGSGKIPIQLTEQAITKNDLFWIRHIKAINLVYVIRDSAFIEIQII